MLKAFCIEPSAFGIQHSAFGIQHSAFGIQHSAYSAYSLIKHFTNVCNTPG